MPREGKARGLLLAVYKRKDRASLFPVLPSVMTRHQGHKLKHWRFSLNKEKELFGVGTAASCPEAAVDAPSLEISKSHQDTALGSWLLVPLLEQGRWTRLPPKVPSNLNHSYGAMILIHTCIFFILSVGIFFI